jgi:hypothetical protein
VLVSEIVWLSGRAFAAISSPIDPVPPARLSTTTFCPHSALSFCATARVVISPPPPGAIGTMKRTGLAGNDCAAAGSAASKIIPGQDRR